jgi:hypothetical protein
VAAKTVAIVQSCYIPWKGYFDLVAGADEFILYDDRQFTRRDWRNRNRIKTPNGVQWLTIPVNVKGKYHQRIDETTISDPDWAQRHWKTLVHSYTAAPSFAEYAPAAEDQHRDGSLLVDRLRRRRRPEWPSGGALPRLRGKPVPLRASRAVVSRR